MEFSALSKDEVDKLFAEVDDEEYKKFNFKPIFNENSYICAYKFTEKQLKEICIASKCRVHIPTANILFRLEQHYREKKGEPDKNKLSRNKQKRILYKSLREYNKKREYYNRRQEKREITTKEIRKTIWVSNRIKYFLLLNLTFYNPAEIIDGKENQSEFDFTFNVTRDIQIYQKQQNSEPLGSYKDFNSVGIITSTQHQPRNIIL